MLSRKDKRPLVSYRAKEGAKQDNRVVEDKGKVEIDKRKNEDLRGVGKE